MATTHRSDHQPAGGEHRPRTADRGDGHQDQRTGNRTTPAPQRYAVFLRGVNVGGITLRMADVRALLAGLHLRDVATVLASGNVTCTSELDPDALKEAVEDALHHRFGYRARVIVVEHSDLRTLAGSVPGPPAAPGSGGMDPAEREDIHTYVTLFTGSAERAAFLEETRELEGWATALDGGTAVAWFSPKGRSTEMPLARVLARSRHAAVSTTRNVRTIERVLELLA